MAKDILERYITINVDDSGGTARDLSGDLVPGSLSGVGFTHGQIRMDGVSDSIMTYLADKADGNISCQFYMNDTATTGAWTVLKGIVGGAEGTVTIAYGTSGAPASGDPEYEGEHVCFSATLGNNGGAVVINAVFRPGPSADAAWGTVA